MNIVDQLPDRDEIKYDEHGRMLYHPEYHFNHGTRFSDEDLEYLCKYCEIDSWRTLSFALGRTEGTLRTKVEYLKAIGKYEYYKNRNKFW